MHLAVSERQEWLWKRDGFDNGRGAASTMEEVQLRQWKMGCFGSGRGEFLAVIVLGDLNRRKIPSAIVAFDDGSVPNAISWHFLLAITDFCRTFAAEKESEGGDTMSHRCQGWHALASFLSVAIGDQPTRRRGLPYAASGVWLFEN